MSVHRHYDIAVIAGDGIGQEVTPAALAVVQAAATRHGFSVATTDLPWGCEYYLAEGRMMPADGLDRLHGDHSHASASTGVQQRAGNEGLAHLGIGPGDEKTAAHRRPPATANACRAARTSIAHSSKSITYGGMK